MTGEVEQLGERIAELAAHLDAATHRLLTDLREFDARGGWHTQGAQSCAHWLAWRVGWDLATARDRVRVARRLGECAATDDALRRGQLSYSKVRAIVRVATPENEPLLLNYALFMTGSQLDNLCRKYALVRRHGDDARPRDDEQRRYVRRRDTDDGMVKVEAVLHPEEAELVWAMLNDAARRCQAAPDREAATPIDAACAITASGDVSAEPQRPSVSAIVEDPAANVSADARSPSSGAVTKDAAADVSAETQSPSSGAVTKDAAADVSAETQSPAVPSGGVTRAAADVSAETQSPAVPSGGVTRAPADVSVDAQSPADSPGVITCAPADVSAEAQSPADSPGVITCAPADVSAEAQNPAARPGAVAHARADVSAETQSPTASHRAVTKPRHDASSGSLTAPPPSVLHQRESAAKRAFDRADALVSVAQAYVRGDQPNRAPLEVILTVPASSLHEQSAEAADPLDAACMGESCLSVETARRLSCDAAVVDVVEDEHGVPRSVGRKRRTIAGSIKRSLLKRDTACTFPGCTNRIFLEGHHIQHWADGGETKLTNLALLCSLCRARHNEHYAAYRVMPRSPVVLVEDAISYAA